MFATIWQKSIAPLGLDTFPAALRSSMLQALERLFRDHPVRDTLHTIFSPDQVSALGSDPDMLALLLTAAPTSAALWEVMDVLTPPADSARAPFLAALVRLGLVAEVEAELAKPVVAVAGEMEEGVGAEHTSTSSGPSLEHFHVVLEACRDDVTHVMQVYTRMQALGLEPDQRTLELVIDSCAQGSRETEVIELLRRVDRMQIPRTQAMYHSLMHLARRDYKECFEYMHLMEGMGFKATTESFEILSMAMAGATLTFGAVAHKVLQDFRSRELEPTHIFMLNCGRCLKSAADARELFPCLQHLRPDSPGDTPNHTVLFQAMLCEGQALEAMKQLEVMFREKLIPAADTFLLLLPYIGTAKLQSLAEKFLRGTKAHPQLLPCLREILQRVPEEVALRLLEVVEARADLLPPSPALLNAFIAPRESGFQQYLERIRAPPNVDTFAHIFTRAKAPDLQECIPLWRRQGLPLDLPVFSLFVLIQRLEACQDAQLAAECQHWLYQCLSLHQLQVQIQFIARLHAHLQHRICAPVAAPTSNPQPPSPKSRLAMEDPVAECAAPPARPPAQNPLSLPNAFGANGPASGGSDTADYGGAASAGPGLPNFAMSIRQGSSRAAPPALRRRYLQTLQRQGHGTETLVRPSVGGDWNPRACLIQVAEILKNNVKAQEG
uniref:Pentacotripeptide-repeat region of PRORP domain-containing protein n=1 Tax=Eutreptiella gymnastica TaxID=73025 RepID=A0A7S1J2N0_9EUGL